MLTVATSYLNWTEQKFWSSTPRKYIAIKNNYFKMENDKLKLFIKAINPQIEFKDDEDEQGVYLDQIGL